MQIIDRNQCILYDNDIFKILNFIVKFDMNVKNINIYEYMYVSQYIYVQIYVELKKLFYKKNKIIILKISKICIYMYFVFIFYKQCSLQI